MNLYSTGILIAATVYIKAENEAQALEKLKAAGYTEREGAFFDFDGEAISGHNFENPELPEISLSPMMTCRGLQGDRVQARHFPSSPITRIKTANGQIFHWHHDFNSNHLLPKYLRPTS